MAKNILATYFHAVCAISALSLLPQSLHALGTFSGDSGGTCSGVVFGYPDATKCCEWNGTAYEDFETGTHPDGMIYNYTTDKCDAACGVIVSQNRCCGGTTYDAATYYCCQGDLGKWTDSAPCPDADDETTCEIADMGTEQCCADHGEDPDIRKCGAGTHCEYCQVECVCG